MSNPTVYGGITLLITADPALLAAKKINALIITTQVQDSLAVHLIVAKHGDSKEAVSLHFLLAAQVYTLGGTSMDLIKLLAAVIVPLENPLPGNPFAVGLNHPTLR